MRIRTSAMFVALILALAGIANAQVSNTGTITVTVVATPTVAACLASP